jgi:YD repeat-containing protein
MARHSMHAMVVSLNIVDSPVGYAPPRGPAVEFTLTYNQRDAAQPANFAYSNLGNKWTFSWLAYITDDPGNPLADVDYYLPGGGVEPYRNLDTNSQTFDPQLDSRTVLVRTGTNSYERLLPDGSVQVFDLPDGVSNPRKIFMTEAVDPAGNSLEYTYDADLRLVAVTDALSQVTELDYGSTNPVDTAYYQIIEATEPFGDTERMEYADSIVT